MTQTAITTAARRITRTLNTAPASAVITFDKDGHEIGRVYGNHVNVHPGAYLMGARWYETVIQPERWTHARVQAVMTDQDEQA
jgi:hypothetical protein